MPAANEFGMHEYLKTLKLTQSLSCMTHCVVIHIKPKRNCIKMNLQCLASNEAGKSGSKVIDEHVKICRYFSPLKIYLNVDNHRVLMIQDQRSQKLTPRNDQMEDI